MNPQPLRIDEVLPALDRFDSVIDVRSPSEFAEDHLPGALNWPVLDDAERHTVGHLYVQSSPLQARKLGAALVARRIAAHLEAHVHDKPREWRPLVYCWRGGQRSGSLALVLAQIGFRTTQLQGGYKAFRAVVREQLQALPARHRYRVLCGRTGSGKTRLLQALAAAGAQVLDLEALACHRGSILGSMPGLPQPTQKRFDTLVWQALRGFDPARPVFVESESARIGSLRVPATLLDCMHGQRDCLRVELDDDGRIALLLEDYAAYTAEPALFQRQVQALVELCGREQVRAWQSLAAEGRWAALITQLMTQHYDPLYERSMQRSYAGLDQAPRVVLRDSSAAAFAEAATGLLQATPS